MDGVSKGSPRYYDEHRISKEFAQGKYLLVRKDRFVFAACQNLVELKSTLESLPTVLGI